MPTSDPYNLQRFIDAQTDVFGAALAEIRGGLKQSHWMWFIFPQLAQLGRSPTAKFYGLRSIDEACAYLDHPVLGSRLHQSVESLLPWTGKRLAEEIFGSTDSMKLRSSLTLFDEVKPRGPFAEALLNFFDGARDELTLALLQRGR